MRRMFQADALKMLVLAYSNHTGKSLDWIGRKVGNAKVFKRLMDGKTFYSSTGEDAMRWFTTNWPDDLPWPQSIPRPAANDAEAA